MRVSFSAPHGLGREEAQAMLAPVIERYSMTSALHPIAEPCACSSWSQNSATA